MWRRARPEVAVERRGDLVIRGRIHARLLRIPLLDIDAHVVVTPARPPLGARRAALPSSPSSTRSARRPIAATAIEVRDRRPAAPRLRPVAGLPTPVQLARAEDLIAESASLLHEASRLH
jgi:hypothetical protein